MGSFIRPPAGAGGRYRHLCDSDPPGTFYPHLWGLRPHQPPDTGVDTGLVCGKIMAQRGRSYTAGTLGLRGPEAIRAQRKSKGHPGRQVRALPLPPHSEDNMPKTIDKSKKREQKRHKNQHGMKVRRGGLQHIRNSIIKRGEHVKNNN